MSEPVRPSSVGSDEPSWSRSGGPGWDWEGRREKEVPKVSGVGWGVQRVTWIGGCEAEVSGVVSLKAGRPSKARAKVQAFLTFLRVSAEG